ncbi:hypothetical protein FCM35_KLT06582 [Carex littledalei]|uniref:Uncharacterized protein n=1 Tax=Carex littledalei TaxID=544730 RepID=A0A833QU39_9POAL|nr:hypothetical protein FCM35_KLT06582 [Carex littledalei]
MTLSHRGQTSLAATEAAPPHPPPDRRLHDHRSRRSNWSPRSSAALRTRSPPVAESNRSGDLNANYAIND